MKALEISTDSRTIEKNYIYVALKGEKFDGHDFIIECLEKEASKIYSELSFEELVDKFQKLNKEPRKIELLTSSKNKIQQVDSGLKKYQELARNYKRQINPLTIAITGSNGKTTAKEMLAEILKNKFKIHYSKANFNNEIGVPKTILAMPEDTEVLILEMGMRGLGQIAELSAIAEPNISLITCIGTAHIELLGSQENIRTAKLEIIDSAQNYQAGNYSKDHEKTLIVDKSLFELLNTENKYQDLLQNIECDYFSNEEIISLDMLSNNGINASANAVIKITSLLEIEDDEAKASLENFKPINGRGMIYKDELTNIYIDETYNASPETLKLGVESIIHEFSSEPKLIVSAEILENDSEIVAKTFQDIEDLTKNTENKLSFLNLENKDEVQKSKEFLEQLELKEPPQIQEISYQDLQKLKSQNSINKLVYLKASRAAKLDKLLQVPSLKTKSSIS